MRETLDTIKKRAAHAALNTYSVMEATLHDIANMPENALKKGPQ
jgi:hypothetical protein